jgi:predicted dehydrogenase
LVLSLPSPFLRNAPSTLTLTDGEPGTPHSWERQETVAYDEAFKRELIEFHEAIVSDREPRTNGTDGLRDLLLCEAVARAHLTREPVDQPTRLAYEPVEGGTT